MRWKRFFHRAERDRNRTDEMQAHLDLYTDELIDRGLSPEDATRQARLRFGNPRVKREDADDAQRLPILDWLARDVRYACRVLRRSPAFASTAILTLAIVIGANTAVLSLADRLLLRPPPYPHADELAVGEWHRHWPKGDSADTSLDGAMWQALKDQVPSVEAALYSSGLGRGVNLVIGGTATIVRQQRVSSGFFRVLRIEPLLGREFLPEEDRAGGRAVVILGYELWQRAYQGNPGILGQTITLKGEPYEVIGVMPAAFRSLADAEVWTPLRPSTSGEGGGTNFGNVLRRRPGASWARVTAEMSGFSREIFRSVGLRPEATYWMTVRSLRDVLTESDREPIAMLAAGVGAVLLIACVNLGALLVTRSRGRAKEIATRMALGSGRIAVIRQLIVESTVLAVAGGILGVLFGMAGLAGLKALGGTTFEDWTQVTIDARILGMTATLALVTSVLFGVIPALQASRIDVQAVLRAAGSRTVAGSSRRWPRRVLMAGEVALGVVLLVCAGLLVRTVRNLQSLPPGFDGHGVITAGVSLQDARYSASPAVHRLFDETINRIERAPGVEAVGVSLGLPYERILNSGIRFTDRSDGVTANVSYATPGFFRALRIPTREGRGLLDTDRESAPPVAVVNETFARLYSSDRPILGRRLGSRALSNSREIVGVVGDVRERGSGFWVAGMARGPIVSTPILYLPAAQTPDEFLRIAHTWFRPVWTVRAKDAATASSALRNAMTGVDPLLPLAELRDMDEVQAESIAQQRLLMTLVGAVAIVAMLLAAIGIYGVIAQTVAERTREFGIRLALGATAGRTVWSVAWPGIVMAVVGAGIGGLLSIPATRLVQTFLWGVERGDRATYIGVAGVLIAVAATSSLIPALRILRLDPVRTLRE